MSKIKVLMIDDNISLVEMVKEYFKENQKIELSLEAYNGEDGLNMILNKENEYDVILLDIIMPKKDGLYVLDDKANESDYLLTIKDMNDSKFSGYKAKNPLIIFDHAGKVSVNSFREMSVEEVNKKFGKYVTGELAKKIGVLAAVPVSATVIQDNTIENYKNKKKAVKK